MEEYESYCELAADKGQPIQSLKDFMQDEEEAKAAYESDEYDYYTANR